MYLLTLQRNITEILTASDVGLQARAQVKTLLLRRTMQCLYLNGVSDIMTPDRLLNLYC